jgi:dephospho-CoA kinase
MNSSKNAGAYCTGKNYVGRLMEARGLPVLDVNKLGHRAIEAEREAIVAPIRIASVWRPGLMK